MLRSKISTRKVKDSCFGGPFGTVPELLFERKGLIPAIQRLLVEADITP
jgi:hypothetical protein